MIKSKEFDINSELDKLTKRIKKRNSPEKLRKIRVVGKMSEKEERGMIKWAK